MHSSRRWLRAFWAALVCGAALSAVTAGAGAQEADFGAGSGRAEAKYVRVGPSRGSLSLSPTVGLALADFLNTRGRGDVRTADWAALEDSIPPELRAALPSVKVESTDENSEDGQTTVIGPPSDVPVNAGLAKLHAAAGDAPYGQSSFTAAPVDLGLLEINGGRAEAFTGVTGDRVREARATVTIGRVDIAEVLVLEGLEWRAVHRSGGQSAEQASFTVGTVEVAGQRVSAPEDGMQTLQDALDAAEPLLRPLGLDVVLPQQRIEQGVVVMTPLVVRVADPAYGPAVGSVLEGAQPARDALVDAIRSQSEDVDAALLLGDVALGVLAGGSRLDVAIGGVSAETDEPAERFTFGPLPTGGTSSFSPPPAPISGAGAGAVGDGGSRAPRSNPTPIVGNTTTPSLDAETPTPQAGNGSATPSNLAAAATDPASTGGPLLLIGLGTVAAATAAGTIDLRRLLRRRPVAP